MTPAVGVTSDVWKVPDADWLLDPAKDPVKDQFQMLMACAGAESKPRPISVPPPDRALCDKFS